MRPLAVLLLAAVLGLTVGCGPREPSGGAQEARGRIAASGSTALLPLVKTAAEEFQRLHPGLTVDVTGGGSFVGLQQVAEGTVHIGMSDVPAPADDPVYRNLKPHVVAGAPIVFVVHPGVPVESLTREQLAGILTGRIGNWKE
ncbi:MAG: substrate-binding domain-containing protein, partial [Firmicutes bacterium]|nr:substrate-binding domain-containing protein [Bacillota bacterium]